ncbi:MAG: type II toxin-antitoxin system RelE/ParE family toxin [bacterium]
MKIEFRKRKDQQCFEIHAKARSRWPRQVADRYIQRIQIIQQTVNFEELRRLPALRVHELKGDLRGIWSMTIHEKWRLLFELIQADGQELIRITEVSNHYDD